jgi:hypothetical protein
MYHPTDAGENLEFIELYNDRSVSEDLSGFAFTGGIQYEFESGTIIGPKGYLVVARSPAALQTAYGITGVRGPFTGRFGNDGERVELSNGNGEIVISFRYDDERPWPVSPDGTGHSLILSKLGGDIEEASSWSASTFIGGTPGGPDQTQVGPVNPTLVTLVDIGSAGRYFKGVTEPSPGPGGQATTAWTQIGFNDNTATTAWLDGPSGYGYSGSAGEVQYIKTQLSDMNGKYISVYARLRFTLTAEQIASFSQLMAEVYYDDDYVLYLNGMRVAGSGGITGNPPAFSAGRGTGWEPPVDSLDLTGQMGLLVIGTNVLAIQAHNNAISGSSDGYGVPILRGVVKQAASSDDPRVRVVINELLANSDAPPGTDWIELYNPGPTAVDLSSVYLSDDPLNLLQYRIPGDIVLQPGQFWAVRQGTLPTEIPFGLDSAGETVYVTAATKDAVPKPVRVLDAVRYGAVPPDVTFGRSPDGSDYLGLLSSATFNGPNAKPLIHDIVINEIMYNHPTRDDRYEYVELYNRGSKTIPLGGWAFTEGITYIFNDGVQIAPGSYLVVACDPDLLDDVYPNLTKDSNLFGPYLGHLDNHSERIRLSYPITQINPDTGLPEVQMVTADEVTYYDGGRWPKWADGEGTSMELRDPRSNNDSPDAWADSNETAKSQWQQFSFTVNSSDSKYTHDQVAIFDMILLNRGEVLIDDLELSIGGTNRLTNNGFESGATSWRFLGNHVRSYVTAADRHSGAASLHLVATGHGDPGANRINQTIASVTGGQVTFRGWAKWLRGTHFLLLRTTRDRSPVMPPRPSRAFELPMPLNLGTPGQQNTAFVPNRGPDILEMRNTPVLPTANQPIIVTARLIDNDGVASATLYYRSEGTATFTNIPMLDNASGGDAVAGDGIYTATIPGAPAGTMRAFYIEASDGSATTRFPTKLEPTANVPDRTCLVRVGDTPLSTQLATYRIWLSNDVVNTFTSRPNLSNEMMDCTFVYNNTDVFYNAAMRFRGSPFIRSGSGRNPSGNYAYRLDFSPDQRFYGREEVNLDNTEGGSRGPLQERCSYWFYKQMGLQFSMQEFVRLVINGTSMANYEDVQELDGDYIDKWFPNDANGYLHKVDDYFEYTADGTGYSNIDEGLRADASHPALPETYRWHFEKRSHREQDNWDHFFAFAQAMNTSSSSPNYEQMIESVVNPEHLARMLALRHAVGDWDSYGFTRGKNNYFYYAPVEGKWYLLPWDIDFTLGSGRGASGSLFEVAGWFPEVTAFLNYPKYRRMYLQAFAELMSGPWQTSYQTGNPPTEFDKFLDDAANALIADGLGSDRRDGIKQFVRDRRAYILTQIPPLVFEITTNSGKDFCISAPAVPITGSAPLEVAGIAVNGTPVQAQFSGNNVFTVVVMLSPGVNVLNLQGLNGVGKAVAGATDSITVTRVTSCAVASVTPTAVCNSSTANLTIHGNGFAPGSTSSVVLTSASEEIGFDTLYVQWNQSFDRIEAATSLLDDPSRGVGDPVHAVHTVINLYQTGDEGVFAPSVAFAPPFNTGDPGNFAVRFTGYIYAPSAGVRYFGVNSDDGFSLSIAGQLVGQYADARAPATTDVMQNRTAGTMTFNFPAAGSYYMVLDFYENGGGEEIEFFQTDSTGGNPRLINVDAELVVFRDDVKIIDATNVTVVDVNTITCRADLTGAVPGTWNVIVTPPCGDTAKCSLNDALLIVACSPKAFDFNGDSLVNFEDWAPLADNWRLACSSPSWCSGTDIDHSGRVDFVDVLLFAQHWLAPAP